MLEINLLPFPEIKTDRLELRQVKPCDEKEIFQLLTDERVNTHYGGPRVRSLEHAGQYIRQITAGINKNKVVYWAICIRGRFQLVGTVCLWNIFKDEARAEIGYELLPAYQGMGIMQEAFSEVIAYGFNILQLQRIEAWTTRENKRSIRILEKNQFRRDPDAERNIDWTKEAPGTQIFFRSRSSSSGSPIGSLQP